MKFALSHLKKYLNTEATAEEIADTLVKIGIEVESVEKQGQGLELFTVAHILETKQHPNADKLRVCLVDTYEGQKEIVCGAPNARAGIKVIYAGEGMYIPGAGITLKKAEIRGVPSSGMMLSEREMGLSDEHNGILELADFATVGQKAVDVLGLNDTIFDVSITPNRGDWLGILGIARELRTAGIGELISPKIEKFNFNKIANQNKLVNKLNDDSNLVPIFALRRINNVTNKESPEWLKHFLKSGGIRPVSLLVDITNYMLLSYNRPMHVFDANKVSSVIDLRLSNNEEFLALDGKSYKLNQKMLVVADGDSVLSLAGIMGGEKSGVDTNTVDIILEVAVFDRINIARTGRSLNILSDSRYRFERGIDASDVSNMLELATDLIIKLSGDSSTTIEDDMIIDNRHLLQSQSTIQYKPELFEKLTGFKVSEQEQLKILNNLGFCINLRDTHWEILAPMWRSDIYGTADIIEEVIRIFGLEHIPLAPISSDGELPDNARNFEQRRHVLTRRFLASRGMTEVITYSFMDSKFANRFHDINNDLLISNPISSELDLMRETILPNLLQLAEINATKMNGNIAIFEIGPVFIANDICGQHIKAAGLRAGKMVDKTWLDNQRNVDAFDVKADILQTLEAMEVSTSTIQILTDDLPSWYHPKRAARIALNPKQTIGYFGELHPAVLQNLDVKLPVVAFELNFSNIPNSRKKTIAKPLLKIPEIQAITRDFCFIMDKNIASVVINKAVKGVDKKLIVKVDIFDVYEGSNLAENEKSIAFTVTLQPQEKSLIDVEIQAVCDKIIETVVKATGGRLR